MKEMETDFGLGKPVIEIKILKCITNIRTAVIFYELHILRCAVMETIKNSYTILLDMDFDQDCDDVIPQGIEELKKYIEHLYNGMYKDNCDVVVKY